MPVIIDVDIQVRLLPLTVLICVQFQLLFFLDELVGRYTQHVENMLLANYREVGDLLSTYMTSRRQVTD